MHRTLLIIVVILLVPLTVLPANSEGLDDGPARKLINSQGCKACHSLEGDGGILAASFEVMRTKNSRAEIRLMLVNPGKNHGKSKIPDFSHLPPAEIETLVNFTQPER